MPKQLKYAQATMATELTQVSGTDYTGGAGVPFIGVFGDIKVDLLDGGTGVTFKNVPSGSILPIIASKVYSGGTTATDIVMLEGLK